MTATELEKLLLKNGFPADTIKYFVAQALFESPNLSSHVAQADNNLTGITYINAKYQHATRGLKMPLSESKTGYYAHFASLDDWAKDYKRILSFGSKPIESKSLPEFINRLKANNYFTGNETSYLKGVTNKFSALV